MLNLLTVPAQPSTLSNIARNEFLLPFMSSIVAKLCNCMIKIPSYRDDASQEGWFMLTKAWDEFDPDRGHQFNTFATWKVRACFQRYRKRRIHRSPADEILAAIPDTRETATTDFNIDSEELLSRLPIKQAEAIRLHIIGGLTTREAGEALGISYEAVSQRCKYGLAALRLLVPA